MKFVISNASMTEPYLPCWSKCSNNVHLYKTVSQVALFILKHSDDRALLK